MSNTPENLRYTRSHEWVLDNNDGTATIGISDHAQELLGDMVYIETPELDRVVEAGEECAVVESVKAASDVYAPLSGTIIGANEKLADAPELVNEDPYGEGWMFKIQFSDAGQIAALLNASAYADVENED
ncbi:MAG TPA: glycine cleavage system protein GcvH [Gammaproteobacteria bacterium]|nr:glycine cleavage system protein GcvH [Gammaproteobacteria bacterium]